MDSEDESDWDRDFASEVEDGPIGIGLALDLSDTTDDNTSRPLIRGFSTSPADPKDDDIWDDDFTEDESSRSAKDSAGESKLAAPPLVTPSSTTTSSSTPSSSTSTSLPSSLPSAATAVATSSTYSSPSSSNAGSPSSSSRATLCRQPSVARLAQVSLSRTESKLDTAAIERSIHGTLGHSISRRFQKQPGGGGSFLERLAKMQENPKQQEEAKKVAAAVAAAAAADTSEEDEDWDLELGVDRSATTVGVLADILKEGTKGNKPVNAEQYFDEHDQLKDKYRLFTANQSYGVQIVKYPKPSLLYTMYVKEGYRPFQNEQDFEAWITTLISKHRLTNYLLFNAITPQDHQCYLYVLQQLPKFSNKWLTVQEQYCHITSICKSVAMCWNALVGFFENLKSEESISNDEVFRVSIRLLYITAKYWTPTLEEVVASFFAAVKRLWPQEGYMVDILRAEMHCHYSLKTLPPSLPNPCETLLKILRAIQEDKKLEDSRRTCVVAEILIAIQLLSHDLSPLTTSAREGDSKDYSVFFPSSGRRVTRRAVNNDAVLDSSVRMKMLEQSYTSIPASFIKAKAAYVIGHHYMNQEGNPQLAERILFESIFILDQWQEQERDHDGEDEEDIDLESEEYWDDDFQGEEEQMYVQRLFGGVPIGMVLLRSGGSSPVVSQLGSNALVAFGESLLCNYKYKYAILAFNACITNHHMRRKKEYFSLLERMALLSRENEDFRRSINYYREILQKYKEEKKVHEVIYVSEILSSIFAEMGKLQIAESYLLDALSILPKGSTRVDPVVFQLQLKLARLYIEGFAFDKGVHHLELLRENTSTLPKDKRNSVVSLLAEAYTKKKWFKDSLSLLTKELDRDPTTDAPTVTPIRKRSSTPNPLGTLPKSPVSSPFARGQKEPSLMYWELSASNYYHAQEFPQAIFCIDYAISLCSAQSLNARGRLCYLRGKIFQSICLYAETVHFPTNFKPKKLRLPEEFVMATTTPGPGQIQLKPLDFSTIYTCKGDLIQECISTYTRAYSYFSAVGDDIRIARTVSRIAETYLDHLFPQVALQEKIIEDVNTLPPFTPSSIAQERKAGIPEPAKESFVINLARIVSPAELGLEVSADTAHPMLLLKSYMNMAELRFLQGKKSVAKTFWQECKDALGQLFLDELGAFDKASPNFLRRALNLVKRALRFLFALEPENINLNLNLIDSYIQLQTLLENAEKRPPQGLTTTDDDTTDNTLSHVSGNQTHRKKAVSRQPTKQKIVDQQFQPAGVRSRITRRATMAEMFLESSGSNSGRQTKRVATLTDSQRRPDANPDVVEVKVEDIADAIFGSLHCTKMQLKKYTNGKVSQEDLLLRNNETLRRLFRFLLANRLGTKVGTSFKAPATPSVSFEALRDQYPSYLSKLCYCLHIDGFILMYVPSTKHKQVLHLEVKGENHESMHTSGTSSGTLNASSSGSGSGVSKFIWVRVQMMSNEQESGLFVLRPGVTLDSLMSWLTDKSNWSDLASDSSSKSLTSRKLFGSTKGTTTRNVNSPIKLVDPPSKQFWSELGRLASFATGITTGSGTRVSERGHSSHRKDKEKEKERERSRSRGGDEPTEADLCFAAKVQIGDSIPQFTLITQDKMKIPVTQAFPHILEEGENVDTKPLQLYVYVTTDGPITDASGNPLKPDGRAILTQEMMGFFSRLVVSSRTEEQAEITRMKRLVSDMLRTAFPTLQEIVPSADAIGSSSGTINTHGVHGESKDSGSGTKTMSGKGRTKFLSRFKTSSNPKPETITTTPINLVCTKALQLLPWELLLPGEVVARYFSLKHVLGHAKYIKAHHKTDVLLPDLFLPTSLVTEKTEKPEQRRRQVLLDGVSQSLHLSQRIRGRSKRAPSNIYHSPWVKTTKIRNVKYYDLESNTDLLLIADSAKLQGLQYSVFLFSYADLMELPEQLFTLIRERLGCTMLFVPAIALKDVTRALIASQSNTLKTSSSSKRDQSLNHLPKDLYHYLVSEVLNLQEKFCVPIVLVNPPASD